MPLAIDLAEYWNEDNLRHVLVGAGAGALAAAPVGHRRLAALAAGFIGPAMALYVAGFWRWPEQGRVRLLAAVAVGVLAGAGYARLQAHRATVAPLVLAAGGAGVWLAVPESAPALIMLGVLLGVTLTGRASARFVGYGLAASFAWAALLGARTWGWSFAGGLLSLAPLVSVGVVSTLRSHGRRLIGWPWFVLGAAATSFTAARWVGVAPDATDARVFVVAAAAGVLALMFRP